MGKTFRLHWQIHGVDGNTENSFDASAANCWVWRCWTTVTVISGGGSGDSIGSDDNGVDNDGTSIGSDDTDVKNDDTNDGSDDSGSDDDANVNVNDDDSGSSDDGSDDTDDAPAQVCVSADLLAEVSTQAGSSNAAHAARWTQVHNALTGGSGAITLAEVKAIHDRRESRGLSTDQWKPIITALECLQAD